jgi:uncharacterized protein (UPF0548 family)
MFLFAKPTEPTINKMILEQCDQPFSYAEVGTTNTKLPPDYAVLHGRITLGHGAATFARAVEAIGQWKMFDVPNVWLCWPNAPIETGTTVAVLTRHFGFWSLNFCRIVYTIEENDAVRRRGFAYGTLREHAESGEERFRVEWDRRSDGVTYDILSFSRPGNWKTRIATPVAGLLQRHFLRNSLNAMSRYCAG